jgi:hypothetical protein
MRVSVASLCVGVLLLGSACGGGDSDSDSEPEDQPAAASPSEEAEPSPTYAFADYPYKEVSKGECIKTESLGRSKKLTITMEQPPSAVGEFFYPNCVTDVQTDKLTVKLVNKGQNVHNFIVEGNEVEAIVQLDDTQTVEIELGKDKQIAFQCTIHDNFMFGAFFR